jgi:hypothetical protein
MPSAAAASDEICSVGPGLSRSRRNSAPITNLPFAGLRMITRSGSLVSGEATQTPPSEGRPSHSAWSVTWNTSGASTSRSTRRVDFCGVAAASASGGPASGPAPGSQAASRPAPAAANARLRRAVRALTLTVAPMPAMPMSLGPHLRRGLLPRLVPARPDGRFCPEPGVPPGLRAIIEGLDRVGKATDPVRVHDRRISRRAWSFRITRPGLSQSQARVVLRLGAASRTGAVATWPRRFGRLVLGTGDGRVAEWSIAPVLKTGDAQASVGSNPTPSAKAN